jgi:hypothetical protein
MSVFPRQIEALIKKINGLSIQPDFEHLEAYDRYENLYEITTSALDQIKTLKGPIRTMAANSIKQQLDTTMETALVNYKRLFRMAKLEPNPGYELVECEGYGYQYYRSREGKISKVSDQLIYYYECNPLEKRQFDNDFHDNQAKIYFNNMKKSLEAVILPELSVFLTKKKVLGKSNLKRQRGKRLKTNWCHLNKKQWEKICNLEFENYQLFEDPHLAADILFNNAQGRLSSMGKQIVLSCHASVFALVLEWLYAREKLGSPTRLLKDTEVVQGLSNNRQLKKIHGLLRTDGTKSALDTIHHFFKGETKKISKSDPIFDTATKLSIILGKAII